MTTIRQPEAGKSFLLSNDTLSKLLGLLKKSKPSTAGSYNTDTNQISIVNRTGEAVQSFNTLEVTNSYVPSSQDDYSSDLLFECGTPPIDATKLAVLQEPLNDGEVGIAIVSGATSVRVNVTDTSHRFAEPVGDVVLESSSSGPIEILDPPTSTGEQLLKCTFAGGSVAGSNIRARCEAAVTDADATFQAEVTESYPGEVTGSVTVVNPLDAVGSSKHGYTLKENDFITAIPWVEGQYLCIDGPCNSISDETGEPPTDITLSNNSVDEDSPGEVIGNLAAVDADLPDDSHTFEIVGNDGGMEIVSGNILRVKTDAGLDSADSPVVIGILVTDAGDRVFQKSFSITINSVTATSRFALRTVTPVITEPPTQLAGTQSYIYYNRPTESIPNNIHWSIADHDVMESGDTVEMVIKNRGSATLNISDISVVGDLFSSTNVTSTTIAAGAEQTITVTCLSGITTSFIPYFGRIGFTHDGDSFGESSVFVYEMTHYGADNGPAPGVPGGGI